MTKEEAIERLNIHKSTNVFVDSIAEAIDMAIEALMHEIRTETHGVCLISKADAINAVVSWTVEDRPHEVMPTDLVDRIKALPSAKAVSREVYDKRIQADEEIIDSYRQEFQKALSAEAVKVAYICDGRKCDKDCSEYFRTLDIEHARDFKRMGDTYYQQESADGEWIDSGEYPWSKCNKCGYTINCYQEEEFHYCPSCGAKMKGGAE